MFHSLLVALALFASVSFASHRSLRRPFSCLTALSAEEDLGSTNFVENKRESAEAMRRAGYNKALELVRRHSHLVPAGATVLEIGPFLNPLGVEFANAIHWLVWEYDVPVALDLARTAEKPTRSVFEVDLNLLNQYRWKAFWNENQVALRRQHADVELGAAVLSSVLNYVNYRVVLANILDRMRDGGVLFIANSETAQGIGHVGAPGTVGIIEHLLSNYGSRLELLPGGMFDPTTGFTPSSFALAFRVYKEQPPEKEDLYRAILLLSTEHAYSLTREAVQARAGARNSSNVDMVHAWQMQKESLLRDWYAERQKLIDRVREAHFDPCEVNDKNIWDPVFMEHESRSAKHLKRTIFGMSYSFLPERRILLKALDVTDPIERATMLEEELSALYRSIAHTSLRASSP